MKAATTARARLLSAARTGRVVGGERAKAKTPPPGAPTAKKRGTVHPTTRIVQPLPLYLQLDRIGGNMTPQQVSTIIRQADNGYMWQLCDLANEARQKDCHLQGILDTHETELSGLEWAILPPKNPIAKEVKVADFCTKTFDNLDELPDLFAHLAGAFYYGYNNAETDYATDGKYLVPTGFDHIAPRRFVFELTQGRLQQWDQSGGAKPYPGIDLMTEFPGKFIQFQPRVNGDVPSREGLVRVLMWAALFRNWDQRDWLSLAELAWKPWRTGEYAKGASDDDIRNLTSILENMVSNGVAVYPQGTEVKVEWPKNMGPVTSPHAELFDTLGREMSKAVLGNSMTTEHGKHGTQAAAQTGKEMQVDKRNARAKKIAACIRKQLITPLVRMNFGDDVRIPSFRFATEDEVDLLQFSQAIAAIRGAGLKNISARHVRDKMGLPEVEVVEDETGEGIPQDEVLDPVPPPPEVGEPGDEEGAGDKKPAGGPKKPAKKPAAKPAKKPSGGEGA